MQFDYFYKEQSKQYAFYRIPKLLIEEECFQELSTDAKLLYGMLLDRVSLSSNSGWLDEQGRVFIIYTIKSIQRDLHCGNKKAIKLLKELEAFGLIEKEMQGQGKPMLIYVKDFFGPLSKGHIKKCQNDTARSVKTTLLEMSKGQPNNTDITNTEKNHINSILSEDGEDMKTDRQAYYRYFYEQMDMEVLKERYPYEVDVLDAILELVLDVVCSGRQMIRIAGDVKPMNVVRSRFCKLHSGHVEFVLEGLRNNTSKVRNMKQYLLATLYNAPLTMQSYYQAWVNHDMATGRLYGGNNEKYGD